MPPHGYKFTPLIAFFFPLQAQFPHLVETEVDTQAYVPPDIDEPLVKPTSRKAVEWKAPKEHEGCVEKPSFCFLKTLILSLRGLSLSGP